MFDKLFQTIMPHERLSEKDKALCKEHFEPVIFTKNSLLEEANKIPGHLYFVVEGFVRLFHYNEKGEEVTTHINCPPGFITAYISFLNQTHTTENVATITDCSLLRITKPKLDALVSHSIALRNYSFHVLNESIAYNETRSIELATLTAEQRYKKLMQSFPEILQNVPIQYIASFLGMKPESLSRIRKQLIS